ncbi:MAG: hypothetical protein ACI83B_000285 [Sediminicola sp.]|jgi:hypothetical protein
MIKKIISTIKFVLINLMVLLFMLFLVNIFAGYYLKWTKDPARSALPNYSGNEKMARQVFAEYNQQSFKYEAFTGWRNKPYKGTYTHVNEDGLRYYPKASFSDSISNSLRLFGGSTMWGEGSPDSLTIAALIQEEFPNARVFNHGQLAYNSRQNLEALISLINTDEEIGDVVFYDGVNDASFLCPSDVSVPGHRLSPIFNKKIYGGNKVFALEFFHKIFLDKTILLIQKITKPDTDVLYDCDSNPEKVQAIADFMISNWKLAHEIVTARGGDFIAVLQPIAFVGSPNTSHLKLGQEMDKNVQLVYEAFAKRIREEDLKWVYLMTDAFDGEEFIYIDFCHVSPNGNIIIADRIEELIAN